MVFAEENFRSLAHFPVRFSDLDAMGHVNNAQYLTYFEEGRVAWFRECIGMELESFAYPMIVARVELDYLAPINFGSEVVVGTRCSKLGNKSLQVEGLLVSERKRKQVAARYTCTLVYYDYAAEKALPIPEDVRKRIAEFEPGLA